MQLRVVQRFGVEGFRVSGASDDNFVRFKGSGFGWGDGGAG